MSRRTRSLKLTLVGPSLLAAGCAADPPARPPVGRPAEAPAPVVTDLEPQEERALAAALAANVVGNAPLHPLPALPIVVYSFVTSDAPRRVGSTRHYPSSTYRRSSTFVAPYLWTTSRFHAPSTYRPARASTTASRSTTSRTTTSRVGGFGATGRSVSS